MYVQVHILALGSPRMFGQSLIDGEQLSYPDVPVLPLFADIPFTLSIITETKEMKYDAADQHKDVFPVPPSNADNITFLLRRKVEMKVNGLSEERWETLAQLGALGKTSPELVASGVSDEADTSDEDDDQDA